jgi:ubiquinone biosynthesis accessory factor UbiK
MNNPPNIPLSTIFPPIEELAHKLAAGLPEAMGSLRRDLESHFRAVLQGQLARLDLASRTEFSVQTKVLERARTKVEQLEARVSALELRIRELERAGPATS